jgi:hypothetical protein
MQEAERKTLLEHQLQKQSERHQQALPMPICADNKAQPKPEHRPPSIKTISKQEMERAKT